MRARYKPRYSVDRYLGRHGGYDLYVNKLGTILVIRFGNLARDEALCDSPTKTRIAIMGRGSPDRIAAFEHCWDLLRGNIPPDPSVSPKCKVNGL